MPGAHKAALLVGLLWGVLGVYRSATFLPAGSLASVKCPWQDVICACLTFVTSDLTVWLLFREVACVTRRKPSAEPLQPQNIILS